MFMADKTIRHEGRGTTSVEELAHSNMLVNEALIRVLIEKHIILPEEVISRISLLKSESQFAPPEGRNQIVVTREDLISSNSLVVELLLDLLVEKDFLTMQEILELKTRMKERA